MLAVRAMGTASRQRLVHDAPDGAGATAAFRAAAETAIDFAGRAHRPFGRNGPHLMIRDDVARTHDHGGTPDSFDPPAVIIHARVHRHGQSGRERMIATLRRRPASLMK